MAQSSYITHNSIFLVIIINNVVLLSGFIMVHMSAAALSQHFGELAKVRGIVVHKISPFEQKAFAGAISKGVPNTLRRISNSVFRIVPRKLNYKVLTLLFLCPSKNFTIFCLDLVTYIILYYFSFHRWILGVRLC